LRKELKTKKNLSAFTPFSSSTYLFSNFDVILPLYFTLLSFGVWDSKECQEEFLGFCGSWISFSPCERYTRMKLLSFTNLPVLVTPRVIYCCSKD